MAYVVTFVELVEGLLLIVGLLVKTGVGLLSPMGSPGVGAELDLALIAGFLVVLLAGSGRLSLDHALGIERGAPAEDRRATAERSRTTQRSA